MISIVPDTWLERFMGKPTFRVIGTLEGDVCRSSLQRLAAQHAFAYVRVPTVETAAADAFQAAGFRVVDVSVTLEADVLPALQPGDDASARFALADDLAAVTRVAREGFAFSRFHLDPRIDRTVADDIKAHWAGNFFQKQRGDYMVVAPARETPQAFLQLLAAADGTLTIDLVAVSGAQRRKGVAAAMIRFAAHHCPGTKRLRVGTQAANIGSLRLYQRLGFAVTQTAYVLHCHGPTSSR